MVKVLDERRRKLLLSKHTSSANKMHFIAHWHSEGYFVEYQWSDINERVKVRFEPGGKWIKCKSILDDIMSKLDDPKNKDKS